MAEPTAPSERPLRRDAERNRRRILEAARVVFAERGLGGSHDDIAHEAGVGVGTVYRRFPDKEQLIDALFEERVEEIADLARDAGAEPDPWTGLVTFLVRSQELQSEDRGLREIVLGGARGADRALAARSRISPLVEALVQRAHEAGFLRSDVEVGDLPLIHLAIGAIAECGREVSPEVWRRMMGIVVDGLRAQSARTDLEAPALDQREVDAVMVHRGGPRRRA